MKIKLLSSFIVFCLFWAVTANKAFGQDADSCTTLELLKTDVSCHGASDGTINTSIVGEGTYSFAWSNGASTQNLTDLGAGTYSVVITSEQGDQQELAATIVEPQLLSISKTVAMVSCTGNNDGSIQLAVSGGTPPYSYAWSNGGDGPIVSNLPGGEYSVTVTDAKGCTRPTSFTVLESSALQADIGTNSCNDGSLSLSVSGGVTPYSYLWSTGETTKDIKATATGNYEVTVTDAKGCTTSQTITVDQLELFELSASTVKPTCWGGNDGAIDLVVNGGVAPYFYNWSNGTTSEDLDEVPSGSYSVTVTDARACSKDFMVFLANPIGIFISVDINFINCNGTGNDGAIDVKIFNAAEPYTVAWSNGATTEDIYNLTPGSYTITVTDANGCQNSKTINIDEPLAPQVDLSQAYCGDGQICPIITDGTGPFIYQWSDGSFTSCIEATEAGTYSLTVIDKNGCESTASITIDAPNPALSLDLVVTELTCTNDGAADLTVSGGSGSYSVIWNTGATTEDISGLSAGTYDVTVEDANGCTQRKVFNLQDPEGINITASIITNVTCSAEIDGAIDIAVSNGVALFTFSWSNGATSEDLVGIGVGSYTVTVTDSNGCSSTAGFEVITDPVNSTNCPDDDGSTGSGDENTQDGSGDGNASVSFCYSSDAQANTNDDPVGEVNTTDSDCEGYNTTILSTDENQDSGCITYTFEVSHNGNVKYGLSHYTIGVPCGNVSNVSNSEGWLIEFDLVDPTTDLYGFKIDDIHGFGESDNPESFQVTFTVCSEDDDCTIGLEDWSPVVAYKAGLCVDYDTLGNATNTDNHNVTNNQDDEGAQSNARLTFMRFDVYPNPYSNGQKLNVDFSHVNVGQGIRLDIRDVTGNSVFTRDVSIQLEAENIELQLNELKTGIYFVTITGLNKVYAKKLIVQ